MTDYDPQHRCGLEIREEMFNALLRPHFMYCDIIYSATTTTILTRLQQAFNSCLRYVLDLKKYDHISQHSSRLLGCSLDGFDVETVEFPPLARRPSVWIRGAKNSN